ncbi:hypothetical protein FWF74_01135 [Candidatus Saccharibacteria bacterium]|nr:hypothetical protein [Candidatus Saccharibacteria bacterium]MCL1963200.1 hypothetical protein [Candidatus Saccharibacteria bacterium]
MKRLVGDHKYFSERASAQPIAELLVATLPNDLPPGMVIVPLPTIPKHIRERGFDHTKLIARKLSRIRKIPINTSALRRTDNVSQHSATFQKRRQQAEKAFLINPNLKSTSFLLIDDIYTTGATTIAAAKLLLQSGAKKVWLGIVARQTSFGNAPAPNSTSTPPHKPALNIDRVL